MFMRSTRATAPCSGITTGRRGGTTTGTRGLGMWHNYIYFELHDDWVVCLDAKTGKEVWKKEISPFEQQYFSSNAPMVHRQPHDRRHGQRYGRARVSASRSIRKPARSSGRCTRRRRIPATRGWRPGPVWMRRATAAAHRGFPARTIRTRTSIIFGTGNPTPAYTTGPRRRRQPVHVVPARGERRHRQDGVVFPDVAARYARLGFDADADPGRPAVQRAHAQAGDDGDAQRLFLRAGPRDG